MKHKFLLLICLNILIALNYSKAQQPVSDKYVIVTFEDSFKISQHDIQHFFWIVKQDSLKQSLSPLFLTGFSVNDLIDCCSGKPIDPTVTFSNTHYDFAAGYNNGLDSLVKLIAIHRVKIQTVTKNWTSGQKETIVIFATPVIGKFCSAPYIALGGRWRGYKGRVYIPYSSFQFYANFWQSAPANIFSKLDLSETNFRAFAY